jgi:RNA polymerase primary sigma factor
MNMMDFTFEQTPWEAFLEEKGHGGSISAMELITLLSQGEDEMIEDAFQRLLEEHITLDITDLPRGGATGEAALRLRREEDLVKQGALLEKLEENDPLRLYLEELAAIPACGDEKVLAMELAENPTDGIRTALVNLSLSRVVELAGEYTGYGVLLLDLIQEGSLGLWEATAVYCGGDFGAQRDWWIRQYMAKAAILQAMSGGVSQKLRQAMEDYRSVDERLLSELGRNATLEEIAEGMHVTVEEAALAAQVLDAARMIHRAKVETEEPQVQDTEDDQAVEDTAYFQTRQLIAEMLSGLTETEQKLISLRFGLEGGLPLSPEETGRKLGLTPEEVVAMESAALLKMRTN